jgi:hypothetical protein
MDSVSISYRIKLASGKSVNFDFDLDAETFELPLPEVDDAPKWTELEFKQCSHCPLNADEHSHCPLALNISHVIDRLHDTKSIDEVDVEVITHERRVIQTTAIQKVVASLFDLLFPVSGCPHTAYMRPLARFHVPLVSEEEMIFRVTSMYQQAQYFLHTSSSETGQFDFDGLVKIYEDLHTLNVAIAKRLTGATQSDSVKNAVTLVDMYSTLVPMMIEDQLSEMRGFFKAFLPEGDTTTSTSNLLERAKAFSLELVPLDGEDDGVPDWLKPASGEPEAEQGLAPVEEEKTEEEDPLADRTFSFDLEPIDGEPSARPASGKASFSLPDDN